jgi:hypothetical protein
VAADCHYSPAPAPSTKPDWKGPLQQDGRVVARFASDSTGHFLVYAAPGPYVVVPDEPIGIAGQTPEVTVGADGLTHVDLTFDTGIR